MREIVSGIISIILPIIFRTKWFLYNSSKIFKIAFIWSYSILNQLQL